ncbi:ABC transporter ATP-binding protein [Microvirga arsenatis]|uniref:Sn-glycerol-3-phosphate ABC transporter ATP-binding protein UgpC n=1 Tax=Microvirga arsenatis TaxID=2692265 RepID=A0ABW9Z1U3_9HYPH|nr:sn-glycerol-3-phosphate ABC transporter ATP-binding protein UgpC [Microvirga arsenatis]NBJ11417.1 sn-glycerol-3-phosphate ABC transporter ATP-binding protein UgpC [Microvirga arsenatis]NBJ25690.1 sn-glycerol-3-phosphate ABC transporter ATP-binding protein UgpC [Microvirga arsenatis]
MSSVSVRDVTVAFEAVQVFDGLSLDIQEGEFIVLLGPSGCGKSTLLNAIAGLLDVAEGQIWINGKNVTWEEPKDRGIAMVFQSYALYPRMSVRENMSFGLKMARTPKPEIERRVARAAELLQITPLLDRRPDQLSGGQRQRVAIGRALVRDAAVFLFDEPLSNLDAKLRNELRVEIKRLHARLGKTTMVYVTHDQIEAMTLADRIVVMKEQKIQQIGTPDEIYHRPANLFVAGFVGSPQMNFIKGRIENTGEGLSFLSGERRLSLAGYQFAATPLPGREVVLGIRPEHLKISGAGTWPGFKVDIVEPMGADTVIWCSDGAGSVQVRIAGSRRPAPGESVTLHVDPTEVSLFAADSGERL